MDDCEGELTVEMQNGELIDRLSILLLRVVNSNPTLSDALVKETMKYLQEFTDKAIPSDLLVFLHLLYVNARIWSLESEIRKGKEEELGLEEVGKRALGIRNWNRVRVELKNSVSSYAEIKQDHVSAEKAEK
jgi:hypothetical protein